MRRVRLLAIVVIVGVVTVAVGVPAWASDKSDTSRSTVSQQPRSTTLNAATTSDPSSGMTSGPASSSWGPNRIDTFARGGDGMLWHQAFAGQWYGWESLDAPSGGFTGDPAAVSWAPGRIDVFVRGNDNHLWHRAYAGQWYAWEDLGGTLASSPAVASMRAGRLDIFAKASDGQLQHKWWNGSWSSWENLGGQLGSDPGAVSWGSNRIDVFVRGTDNQLWHKWFAGTTWSGWEPLGGGLGSGPGVSSWGPNRIDVFVAGTDNQLWHLWFDGSGWRGWEPLGGTLTADPDAVSWSWNRIDVFVRGTDNQLWHKFFGGTGWSGWDIAGPGTGGGDSLHAAVSVSPATGVTPLRVTADASASTDTDSSPIATYRFDFGDGTIVGPQAKPTATHTYSTAGSYTVGVTVTDTTGHTSSVTAASHVVADSAPSASLLVTPAWNVAPLAVTANASASTDTDATPIATFGFDFGDGTAIGPQATATVSHTYSAAGTYTVSVTVTDTGGLTETAYQSVDVAPPAPSDIAVYAGYYDTHHPHHLKTFPDPWQGSNNTFFVGLADPGTGGWDSSAVRVDNTTSGPLVVTVTVTIDRTTYDLWGAQVIPAGQSLVLAQTAFENFDGSDTNIAGKYGSDPALCDTSVLATVPVINVTFGGSTSHYFDRDQILNTGGVDSAGCPYTGTRNDESEPWSPVPGPG